MASSSSYSGSGWRDGAESEGAEYMKLVIATKRTWELAARKVMHGILKDQQTDGIGQTG